MQLFADAQPLPNNEDQEKAVISCLLQAPDKCADEVCSLVPEDFYFPAYREIFTSSMEVLDGGKMLDLPTLNELLSGREVELLQIRRHIPTIANVSTFVANVKNLANARKLIVACSNVAGDAYSATASDVPGLIDCMERQLFEIGKTSKEKGFIHVRSVMDKITDSIQGMLSNDPRYSGIPTGYAEIDKMIIGLRQQEMIVVAARPSLGKTSLALNMQRRIAAKGHPVGIVSLEMSAVKLGQRQVFEVAEIDSRAVFNRTVTPSQLSGIQDAYSTLSGMPIFYYDSSSDWPTVRRRIRQAVREHAIEVAFIDYLTLLRLGKRVDSRQLEVAQLSSELKELAIELDIPIVVLAQLNREAESRTPKMSDLRESGAIEQDADIVMLLDRKRESEDKDAANNANAGRGIEVQVVIAKNRNGATGIGNLLFFPQFTRFEDKSRMDDEDRF